MKRRREEKERESGGVSKGEGERGELEPAYRPEPGKVPRVMINGRCFRALALGVEVRGLGTRVQGFALCALRFEDWGQGFGIWDLGFGLNSLGFGVRIERFGVWGGRFRIYG